MKIFIIGASGHGKVCLDAINSSHKHEVLGFIDDSTTKHGTTFYGLPVVGSVEDLFGKLKGKAEGVFIAIGQNKVRSKIFEKLAKQFTIVNAIHFKTIISESVKFGQGVLVMAGVIINSDSQIGDGVIINTGATIDHDNIIENFVHIAPGANLAGAVKVGDHSMVGLGSVVIENITIGKNTMIGAGSVVIDNIPDNCIAFGVPAKVKKNK